MAAQVRSGSDAESGRRRRRDDLENEERVRAAAVTTMLCDGRQVPMSAIAAEAGVGVGTLYSQVSEP